MNTVKLDEVHGYAKRALDKALSSGNHEAEVLAEALMEVVEAWASERKEAKEFYEQLKRI